MTASPTVTLTRHEGLSSAFFPSGDAVGAFTAPKLTHQSLGKGCPGGLDPQPPCSLWQRSSGGPRAVLGQSLLGGHTMGRGTWSDQEGPSQFGEESPKLPGPPALLPEARGVTSRALCPPSSYREFFSVT